MLKGQHVEPAFGPVNRGCIPRCLRRGWPHAQGLPAGWHQGRATVDQRTLQRQNELANALRERQYPETLHEDRAAI
eukprot:13359820-Alexandrium_andersonii.AAC.1